MSTTQIIFAVLAAICFVFPFFFWMLIRFLDKQTRTVVWWHRPAKIISLIVGLTLFLLFLLLAIFI